MLTQRSPKHVVTMFLQANLTCTCSWWGGVESSCSPVTGLLGNFLHHAAQHPAVLKVKTFGNWQQVYLRCEEHEHGSVLTQEQSPQGCVCLTGGGLALDVSWANSACFLHRSTAWQRRCSSSSASTRWQLQPWKQP